MLSIFRQLHTYTCLAFFFYGPVHHLRQIILIVKYTIYSRPVIINEEFTWLLYHIGASLLCYAECQ